MRTNDLKAEKYGYRIKPYEFKSVFHNSANPKVLKYNYSKSKINGAQPDWETEPVREMVIGDPHQYQGYKNKRNQWLNSKNVFIVNGVINKIDANFK